eukprot:TRINITY_DN15460_c0_g1_i2.p1 TRINITY_DN15460_c0_g1~~TRINITY_DN15460_c0_g1_i2.p1  ORF type:complete len:861 (+),score=186.32 TRINITY_DN15460_c0_g1_i2:75-2657(+)
MDPSELADLLDGLSSASGSDDDDAPASEKAKPAAQPADDTSSDEDSEAADDVLNAIFGEDGALKKKKEAEEEEDEDSSAPKPPVPSQEASEPAAAPSISQAAAADTEAQAASAGRQASEQLQEQKPQERALPPAEDAAAVVAPPAPPAQTCRVEHRSDAVPVSAAPSVSTRIAQLEGAAAQSSAVGRAPASVAVHQPDYLQGSKQQRTPSPSPAPAVMTTPQRQTGAVEVPTIVTSSQPVTTVPQVDESSKQQLLAGPGRTAAAPQQEESEDVDHNLDDVCHLSEDESTLKCCGHRLPTIGKLIEPVSQRLGQQLLFLSLAGNELSDAGSLSTPLACLERLTELDLSSNKLVKLPALQRQRRLLRLDASRNLLKSSRGLLFCEALQHVSLANNYIRRVEQLETLKALDVLDVSNNELGPTALAALRPLSACSCLRELRVSGNPMSSKGTAYRAQIANFIPSIVFVDRDRVRFMRKAAADTPSKPAAKALPASRSTGSLQQSHKGRDGSQTSRPSQGGLGARQSSAGALLQSARRPAPVATPARSARGGRPSGREATSSSAAASTPSLSRSLIEPSRCSTPIRSGRPQREHLENGLTTSRTSLDLPFARPRPLTARPTSAAGPSSWSLNNSALSQSGDSGLLASSSRYVEIHSVSSRKADRHPVRELHTPCRSARPVSSHLASSPPRSDLRQPAAAESLPERPSPQVAGPQALFTPPPRVGKIGVGDAAAGGAPSLPFPAQRDPHQRTDMQKPGSGLIPPLPGRGAPGGASMPLPSKAVLTAPELLRHGEPAGAWMPMPPKAVSTAPELLAPSLRSTSQPVGAAARLRPEPSREELCTALMDSIGRKRELLRRLGAEDASR